MTKDDQPPAASKRGLTIGLTAYLFWGLMPLYLAAMRPAGPGEIAASRVAWSAVIMLLVTTVRRWRGLLPAWPRGRDLAALSLGGVLIAINWLGFVVAVALGRLLDGALGFFIAPLVTVALGAIVLRERLRWAQWVVVGLGIAAVIVIAAGYGQMPWIALMISLSLGFYGLIEKQVGNRVGTFEAFTVETVTIAPLAVIYLAYLQLSGTGHFTGPAWWAPLGMIGLGVITTAPNLLFNQATRMLPLFVIGMMQYLAPICHVVIATLLLGEVIEPTRWVGFGLVWAALITANIDGWRSRVTHRPMAPSVGLDATHSGGLTARLNPPKAR